MPPTRIRSAMSYAPTSARQVRILVLLICVCTLLILNQMSHNHLPPAPNTRLQPSFDTTENLTHEVLFERLFARGNRWVVDPMEKELTAKYWKLDSWLSHQARINNCSCLHEPPPPFFDFSGYNLWTEPGDRTLAHWVWQFQWLINRIVHATTSTNLSTSTPTHKHIFVGNIDIGGPDFRGAFKPDWLTQHAVSGCHAGRLAPCFHYLDSTCSLITEEPDQWEGHVDMIVTWADTDPLAALRSRLSINIPWLRYVMESPYILPVHLTRSRQFVTSYEESSPLPHKLMKWLYFNPHVRSKPQSEDFTKGKTKLAAILVSNCNNTANNRLEYVRQLQRFIPVDVYGKCGDEAHSCPKANHNACLVKLQRDYFFYLSFENANCRDYVTEKFHTNGLGSRLVPVVMGAQPTFYHKHSPQNSYIHVEDFSGPEHLASYLRFLASSPHHYNRYFEWRGTGTMLPQPKFLCRLCTMLHYELPLPQTNPLPSKQWLPNTRPGNRRGREGKLCLHKGQWYWAEKQKKM